MKKSHLFGAVCACVLGLAQSHVLLTSGSALAGTEKGVICHITGNGSVKSLSVAVSSHQDHLYQHGDYFPETYFADTDGDGFGNATDSKSSCVYVLGYVLNNTDLDDTDPTITDEEPVELVIEAGDSIYNSFGCAEMVSGNYSSLFFAANQPSDFMVLINGVEESATNYNPLLNIALNSFSNYQLLLDGFNILGLAGTTYTLQPGGAHEITTTITESYFDAVNNQANFVVEFQIKILYPDANGNDVPATLNYSANYIIDNGCSLDPVDL